MEESVREPRPEKVAVVTEVRERFSASSAAILTEYRGLPVSSMEGLRRSLSAAGGEYKVYKNTLVRRAVTEIGLEHLVPLLEGPTAIAFVSGDVAAVAKVLRDFARTHPTLVVKGGLMGASTLDARQTAALAELPTRDVLLAQFAGALAAPMQRFAALLAALPQKFAYGLAALVEQREAAGERLPAPEASAAEAPAAETAPPEAEPVAAEVAAAEVPPAEQGADAPAAGGDGEDPAPGADVAAGGDE
ncbi:MAG TPA: 50S ribosomal protein L10 [Acidimicrobiales bacterium]|nr:50S ribosomal protein L10 [Acidimicrobiales bacterium]